MKRALILSWVCQRRFARQRTNRIFVSSESFVWEFTQKRTKSFEGENNFSEVLGILLCSHTGVLEIRKKIESGFTIHWKGVTHPRQAHSVWNSDTSLWVANSIRV